MPTRRSSIRHRRDRPRRRDHDLRHRSAHHERRRPRRDRRTDPRPRGSRHGHCGRRRSTPRTASGDRVLVSCITSCGTCRYCREGHAGQCLGGGGWILGHRIDGTQAEFVRVPFADLSTYRHSRRCQRRSRADARRHPADRLRGRCAQRPGSARRRRRRRRRRPDRPRRDHGSPPLSARRRSIAIDLADSRLDAAKAVRRRRHRQQLARGSVRGRAVAHRRARRGRRHRSSRRTGHLRTDHVADPPRRTRRQHRRAWPPGDPAPRGPVDPQRDDHDRPGRRLLDPDPAAPDRQRPTRRRTLGDPPLRVGRDRATPTTVFGDAADTGALKVVLTAT